MSVPRIRVDGFNKNFEKKIFGEIVRSVSTRMYIKSVVSDLGKYEVIQQGDTPILGYSDDQPFEKYKSVILFGDHTLSLYLPKAPFLLATDGIKILQSTILKRDYLYYLTQNYIPKSQGYKRHFSVLKQVIVNYSQDYSEQSAIGSLFRTLDDLLAVYKNNLANYQSLKATMLSKMFPKAGQTVPEIRLDGFEGEWKFSSLGEQADITKLAGFEFTNHVVYSDEGQIPAIRGLNVKNQKVNLSDVKYIDKSDFSKLDRSKLIEDDLLFTYVGTVGEVARVPESVLWYLAPNVSRLRLNSALDSRFVLYQMASNRFKQKQIFPLIATSSQPALSMANIRKFIISFTTLEEQQAIGSYFSNLDNLIASHQDKISQLETLKEKLLQDMFI